MWADERISGEFFAFIEKFRAILNISLHFGKIRFFVCYKSSMENNLKGNHIDNFINKK